MLVGKRVEGFEVPRFPLLREHARNAVGAKMENFSLRVSEQWSDRLNSAQCQCWLADFLQNAHTLPADPGTGSLQISLSLPRAAVRALSDTLGDSAAVALRRLIALNLGMPLAAVQERPPEPQGASQRVVPSDSVPLGCVADDVGFSGLPDYSSLEYTVEDVSESVQAVSPRASGWSGLSIEAKATLIFAAFFVALIILSWKFGKRRAIPSAGPTYIPWIPLDS